MVQEQQNPDAQPVFPLSLCKVREVHGAAAVGHGFFTEHGDGTPDRGVIDVEVGGDAAAKSFDEAVVFEDFSSIARQKKSGTEWNPSLPGLWGRCAPDVLSQPTGRPAIPRSGRTANQSNRAKTARRTSAPLPIGPTTFLPSVPDSAMRSKIVSPSRSQARNLGLPGQVPTRLNLGRSVRNSAASWLKAAASSAHASHSTCATARRSLRWRRASRSGFATR